MQKQKKHYIPRGTIKDGDRTPTTVSAISKYQHIRNQALVLSKLKLKKMIDTKDYPDF